MSLENNLERIANALETIANHVALQALVGEVEKAPRKPRGVSGGTTNAPVVDAPPAPPVEAAPVVQAPPATDIVVAPPAAPVESVPVVQAPPVAAAPVATMTPAELNDALVIEYHRLGNNRDAIVEEMAKFGVTSVNDLPVDKYQPLLDAVKARTK